MMKVKTKVGQILLTHPGDENYPSLYEESFSKNSETVELFAVLEVADSSGPLTKTLKTEYDALAQTIVNAFKKTYITAPFINEETFEKALAAINGALSRLAGRGRVDWYGKLNAAVGVVFRNRFSLSVTGRAFVFMLRKGELTSLSEDLAGPETKPVKIFSNYASGKLLNHDRVFFSTAQLSNYLSLERIRESLKEEALNDACQEIIASLSDVKTVGFAAFVFEVSEAVKPSGALLTEGMAEAVTAPGPRQAVPQGWAAAGFYLQKAGRLGWSFIRFASSLLVGFLSGVLSFLVMFFRKRPKKYLTIAIALVLLVLLVNVGVAGWRKFTGRDGEQQVSALTQAENKLSEAEATLIYDEGRATELMLEAQNLLADIRGRQRDSGEYQTAETRLQDLKSKLNKELRIDNPTVLTEFPNIPTDVLRSPDGFLGFNRNTLTLSFYDFRSGETQTLLANENTSDLVLGEFVGGVHGYVFLKRGGAFEKFDAQTQTFATYDTAPAPLDLDSVRTGAIDVLGEGDTARLYLLDTRQNQILRFRFTAESIGNAEFWLSDQAAQMAEATDFAIDGNIYVQFPERTERYFNGQRQDFRLAAVSPPLQNALKIFTRPEHEFLYIGEPDRERILVFAKNGSLNRQIISPKLRELADFYVDEPNSIIYALAGAELLQIDY